MEYNYLLPRKKERRGRMREACVSVSFLPYRKTLYIVAWWRKKTTITLNKEVKKGEIRELERIMVINGVNGGGPVKEALI